MPKILDTDKYRLISQLILETLDKHTLDKEKCLQCLS